MGADMRISLPTRIPVAKALLFTSVLVLVELVEGTLPLYALLVFCYFMLSVLAFNVAGGFTRPSGAYIFFYATLVAGVGTVYKAILGQAADTHLFSPVLIMSLYTATLAIMLLSAFLTRRFVTTRDGVAGILNVPKLDLGTSALGCIVIVFLINSAFLLFPGGSGTILHAISMVNYFLPLGILLGTIHAIRSSGGRRSTSVLTLVVIAYATFDGLLSFGKQGMFTPFVCWVIGMAWARFELKGRHLVALALFAVIAQGFLVPLSTVGRNEIITGSPEERLAVVEKYVFNPGLLRQINQEKANAYASLDIWYYGKEQGIFDRLTMLQNDSQLVDFTAQGHYFGYLPIYVYFQNWVPHIINPHKLEGTIVGGNRYAHELGQLADADDSTGISYSPSAEAFHLDGWTSTLLIQPLIYLLVFITTDAVCGDLRSQPWGLLPLLLFAHLAPEELLGGTITYVWLGNIGTIFAIFVSGYITPVFGKLLQGRERTPIWRASLPSAMTTPTRAEAT